MKFPRYEYKQAGVPTIKSKMFFSDGVVELPKFDRPCSAVENLKRAARHNKPYWVPVGLTDLQSINPTDLLVETAKVQSSKVNVRFQDWFGADWTFVASAGGPMLTPGVPQIMEDVTEWESVVKFPDVDNFDFAGPAEEYLKTSYDPDKALEIDIGLGCTERFVSLMGGYEDAMVSFATEPEACAAFFERFIDWEIAHFDKLFEHYPVTMINYHDDWGSEKDTFFSSQMLEDLIFKPTKRFFDHIKSKDVIVQLHSCGNINRFIPYMIDLGVEFMQIQRRVVDFPKVKEKYGGKIGFCGMVEGLDFGGPPPEKEKLLEMIRNTIDILGKGGGLYLGMFMSDPELLWAAVNEIYAYSSEKYSEE
ncbi:MAG: hypothetical protein LBN43_01655 [Oscillospiraceae bacterium]|jgi:hypothetical protein|nr:hypothetical protein [Oscillospiraceae bacterium]